MNFYDSYLVLTFEEIKKGLISIKAVPLNLIKKN